VISTDCAARRCSAEHALTGIAVATMTSLRHRPTTGGHDRRTLAEVYTVPMLLVIIMAAVCNTAGHYIFALWCLSFFFLSSFFLA